MFSVFVVDIIPRPGCFPVQVTQKTVSVDIFISGYNAIKFWHTCDFSVSNLENYALWIVGQALGCRVLFLNNL